MTKKKEKEEDVIKQINSQKEAKEELLDIETEKKVFELEEEMNELQSEAQENLDGWKRCQADFENYKKRQVEAQKDFIRFSTESVILQLLPILDNFHASTDHVPNEQKDTPWVVGIMHIQKQLESVLTTYGVTEIETKVGNDFNPEIHEAVEDKDKKEAKEIKNKIAKIVQKGYKMDNKIIRAVRVTVE